MIASDSNNEDSNGGYDWHQLLFQVPTRVHNETGYWGPVDANHQFCEEHYAVTPFVAEFYNSVSSLIFTMLALYLFSTSRIARDGYCRTLLLWLAVIGLGSLAFHATMRYQMQLLDEIPMVGFMGTVLLSKVVEPNMHPWITCATVSTLSALLVVLSCVSLVATYAVFNQYEIFTNGFAALCVFNIILDAIPQPNAAPQKQPCHVAAVFWIALGKMVWEVENRLCHSFPMVWPLHVVWHLCSCASAYFTILNTFLFRNPQEKLSIARIPATKDTHKKQE